MVARGGRWDLGSRESSSRLALKTAREYPGGMSTAASTSPSFRLTRGDSPLLVSVPHAGTELPPAIRGQLTAEARSGVPVDTDHFVDQLYDFVPQLGSSLLVARMSRWVVDLNRPSDNLPLYPGQAGTGLVPTTRFDGVPIWMKEPDAAAIEARVDRYWRPYHQALVDELARKKAMHGFAILFDAHSILSRVPRLFDGVLPDLNLGTNSGASCDPELRDRAARSLAELGAWSSVVDGRFKGGHITRHHGQPATGVHALQLELAQSTYMDERVTPAWNAQRAAPLVAGLKTLLEEVLRWRP